MIFLKGPNERLKYRCISYVFKLKTNSVRRKNDLKALHSMLINNEWTAPMLTRTPFRGNLQKYHILISKMNTVGKLLIVILFCRYPFENRFVNKKVITDFLPEFLCFVYFFEVTAPFVVT